MTAEHGDSQATKDVLDRFYAAVISWDEDELAKLVADDAELHQPPTLPYGKIYRGRDELMDLWKNVVMRLVEPGTAFVDNMVIDGEFAVVIAGGQMNGKDTLACEEYQVRNDQIVRIRMFWYDPTPVAAAARELASAG
jgi:ketosteroid isomerase-like protein